MIDDIEKDKEVWRLIPSLEDYIASSQGRVMRVPWRGARGQGLKQYGGIPKKGSKSERGRMIFRYKSKTYKVHRLVCEAFHGPPPSQNSVVMHLDDNPSNNRPENLAWGTQKQNLNSKSFVEYCKNRSFERILSARDKSLIKESTLKNVTLAKFFKVAPCTISRIKNGHRNA